MIQVVVGDQPIRSPVDVALLQERLVEQQEYYRANGRFQNVADRQKFIQLFEQAIRKLDDQ